MNGTSRTLKLIIFGVIVYGLANFATIWVSSKITKGVPATSATVPASQAQAGSAPSATQPRPPYQPQLFANFASLGNQICTGLAGAISALIVGLFIPRDSTHQDQLKTAVAAPAPSGLAPDGRNTFQELIREFDDKREKLAQAELDISKLRQQLAFSDDEMAQLRAQLVRTESLARENLREGESSYVYRFIFLNAIGFAVCNLVSILIELGIQDPTVSHNLPQFFVNFAQSISLCVLSAICSAYSYDAYRDRRQTDFRLSVPVIIGAGGIATASLISLLLFTPAMYMAISADNWTPPIFGVHLFYFLSFTRLFVFPLAGALGALVVWITSRLFS